MSKFLLEETSIPMAFSSMMGVNASLEWEPADTADFYKVLAIGFGEFLGMKKNKSGKTCIKVQDTKGPVKFAGIVGYVPNEGEEDGVGNWSVSATFNESDLEGIQNDFTICDTEWQVLIEKVAMKEEQMSFRKYNFLHSAILCAIDCLKEFLDQNAKEGEEVTVELPDYFEAAVGVEGGEKVMSFTFGSQVKRLVKGDAGLEN